MSRYVALEIRTSRRKARAQVSDETSTTEGIVRDEVLEAMSEADSYLQGCLLDEIPDLSFFNARSEIQMVASQQDYTMPGDMIAGGAIGLVEYSYNGEAKNYTPIRPLDFITRRRYPGIRGQDRWFDRSIYTDLQYHLRANVIEIHPPPISANGKVRIEYPRMVDRLDVRRGTIASTPNDGTYYEEIVLENDAVLDETLFPEHVYLCVNDKYGTVERYNIPYDSYNSSTRTFTLPALTVAIADGAITAGNYITVGEYTTTHSKLPRNCDTFRIQWATYCLQNINTSADAMDSIDKFQTLKEKIVAEFMLRNPQSETWPMTNEYWR